MPRAVRGGAKSKSYKGEPPASSGACSASSTQHQLVAAWRLCGCVGLGLDLDWSSTSTRPVAGEVVGVGGWWQVLLVAASGRGWCAGPA